MCWEGEGLDLFQERSLIYEVIFILYSNFVKVYVS